MSLSISSSSSNSDSGTKASAIQDEHCLFDVKWGEFSYLWTIKHFKHFHCKMNEVLKSTVFSIPTHPECKWYLKLRLKNSKPEHSDYFSLHLYLEHGFPNDVLVGAKFSLLDGERNEANIRRYYEVFTPAEGDFYWGFSKFISKETLLKPNPGKEILHEDSLTVLCELKIATSNSITTETVRRYCIRPTISESDVLKSLEGLLLNQDLIDVTFSLNGKSFGAHKIILAARSPVFAAMFKHDMQENRLNKVDIPDMNPEVFEAFLQYLYTDKTPDPRMVRDLLVAAEKYDVGSLKLLCGEILLKDLSEENAIDVLVFADLHRAEHLKKQVIFYIKTHFAQITSTQSWKNTILAHPHLFDEVNGVDEHSVSTNILISLSSNTESTVKRRRRCAKKKI